MSPDLELFECIFLFLHKTLFFVPAPGTREKVTGETEGTDRIYAMQ